VQHKTVPARRVAVVLHPTMKSFADRAGEPAGYAEASCFRGVGASMPLRPTDSEGEQGDAVRPPGESV